MDNFSKSLAIATSVTLLSISPLKAEPADFFIGLGVGVLGKTIVDHATSQPNRTPPQYDRQVTQPPQVILGEQPRQKNRTSTRSNAPRLSAIQIRDIQFRLNQLGYEAGRPDGVSGKRTRRAIRAFQRDHGHKATGYFTVKQLEQLYARSMADQKKAPAPQTNLAEAEKPAPEESTQPIPPIKEPQDEPTETGSIPAAEDIQPKPPSILGLFAGAIQPDLEAYLKANGYATCTGIAGHISCLRSSDALADKVDVFMLEDTVVSITRTVKFKEPAPRTAIMPKLEQAYPSLTQFDPMAASSDEACRETHGTNPRALLAPVKSSPRNPQVLRLLAKECENLFTIQTEGDAELTSLTITLFDGAPIRTQIANKTGLFEVTSKAAEELKF